MTLCLTSEFIETRQFSEKICHPLRVEDYVVQPVVDVSPPKWHLGHTTWFFEEFVLVPYVKGYQRYHPQYAYVFNSYYEAVGKRVVRTDRGNLSRPTVEEVYEYRNHVTQAMHQFLETEPSYNIMSIVEIGIHHEKQHQELLLTDIKFILGHNPLLPVYNANFKNEYLPVHHQEEEWIELPEDIYEIGHKDTTFCYDNELGRHKVFLPDFKISPNLVTVEEWLHFIKDKGYETVALWHAEGWQWVQDFNISAPLYWHYSDGEWWYYTLQGLQKLDPQVPVTHISYYEAFAFAQWKGQRLPTEFEWEAAHTHFSYGQRWEWTESAYLPYPGYVKPDGALGEYNGKFMVNQKVLRGGSIATPNQHIRHTYRNFFHPQLRWQYTGLRLAQ